MFPSLFLSHGSPMLPLTSSPACDFLLGLGRVIGKRSAILVASAHWETAVPTFNAVAENATIHDFHGFPRALYALRYDAPGAPELAEKAAGTLRDAGLGGAVDTERGLDHGAWVPLSLMYPAADIPVVQVSLQFDLGPARSVRVGHALASLRNDNVLIVGSGSLTHNLSRIRHGAPDAPQPPDVTAFADWFDAAITGQRRDDLLNYRSRAPYAVQQHPTEEHLLPLYVALGAAGAAAVGERLHSSAMYSGLRMDAYSFR